jgi:hypothetical protein
MYVIAIGHRRQPSQLTVTHITEVHWYNNGVHILLINCIAMRLALELHWIGVTSQACSKASERYRIDHMPEWVIDRCESNYGNYIVSRWAPIDSESRASPMIHWASESPRGWQRSPRVSIDRDNSQIHVRRVRHRNNQSTAPPYAVSALREIAL